MPKNSANSWNSKTADKSMLPPGGSLVAKTRPYLATRQPPAEFGRRIAKFKCEATTMEPKRPVKNTIIGTGVLTVIAFLAGYVPSYVKVRHLESDLSQARQEN